MGFFHYVEFKEALDPKAGFLKLGLNVLWKGLHLVKKIHSCGCLYLEMLTHIYIYM